MSSFSGLWAQLLARAWGEGHLRRETLPADVQALAKAWHSAIKDLELPWFAREKVRQGTHAALIGLAIQPGGTFLALSVGDCCLFQVRADTLIEAFPARHPEALDAHPYLISTQGDPSLDEAARTLLGRWQSGDTLFLMSDALARWFLESVVIREQRPWTWLETLTDAKALPAALRPLQADGLLARDDVTLAVMRL
jgi:hypothetical protein